MVSVMHAKHTTGGNGSRLITTAHLDCYITFGLLILRSYVTLLHWTIQASEVQLT